MYYQIDENGFYLGIKSENNEGMEFYTDITPVGVFNRHKFDGTEWIEGEALPIEVPQVITRRQFKIALAVLGKNEQDILNGISQLPEPTKTIALISYTEAGTFERNNPELIFVGKTFLQMTDEQIDEIFNIGNQY
jgi:hypothetical protein